MFECPHAQCKREYLSQRNLNAHLKSYHDKQRFPCEEPGCGRTFATKVRCFCHTISIGTDSLSKTVQIQISLLLKEQSDLGLYCLSFYLLFSMHYMRNAD